jgi:hypothetical protein
MRAYVLIQSEVSANREELTDELVRIPGVHVAQRVSGPYDIIAEVDGGSVGTTDIVARVSSTGGVLRALVSPVVEQPGAASEDAA